MADLDYLPLAGGKKGTLRFHVALTILGGENKSTCSGDHDIPKAVFDPTRPMHSRGTFSGEVSEKGVIPLFYQLSTDVYSVVTSGKSPAEVAEDNPVADILIVYLLFK